MSLNITSLADTYREVKRTNLMLMEERTPLIRELEEERRKRSKQEEKIVETLKMLDSLEEVMELTAPPGSFSKPSRRSRAKP